MIQLEALSVQIAGTNILDRIDLTIGAEVVALVGPSCSGKTTPLPVLLGLQTPTTGRVMMADQLMSHDGHIDVPPEERNIAMVFQDLALWPHLSVHVNLEFGLKARRVDKATRERRIAATLATVGLEGKALRAPHELSGGERQRVAIARALVLDPVALLLDEPLGSLDVALKDELLELFAKLFAERKIPVLYVTHDPREAVRLGQRIVVLEAGRITQQGTISELEKKPATPFIEAFVRASSSFRP